MLIVLRTHIRDMFYQNTTSNHKGNTSIHITEKFDKALFQRTKCLVCYASK